MRALRADVGASATGLGPDDDSGGSPRGPDDATRGIPPRTASLMP